MIDYADFVSRLNAKVKSDEDFMLSSLKLSLNHLIDILVFFVSPMLKQN